MAKATDIIPPFDEVMRRLDALPRWALVKASEITEPTCPPPGVLYVLAAPRKMYLHLTIAEALVEASNVITVEA